MAFDSKYALNDAIRYLTKVAERRAAGGWVPPKERERQQREAMRQEQQQARQAEKQQQAQQKQFIADEKERQKNLAAFQKGNHPDIPHVLYHHGSFDETEDGIPVIGKNGMHFGTRKAAEERAYGKYKEDTFDNAEYHQDEHGKWHWYANGVESQETRPFGFNSKEIAKNHLMNEFENWNEDFVPEDLGKFTQAHLSIKNPKRVSDQQNDWAETIEKAKAQGYDGLIYRNQFEDKGKDSYVAFYPHQIKSATGNSGHFDPSNPDITKSEGGQILSKQFPTQYMPNVGRQVMADGGKTTEERQQDATNMNFNPTVLYHAGHSDFPQFELQDWAKTTGEKAHFFTTDPAVADSYLAGQYIRADAPDAIKHGVAPMGNNVGRIYAQGAQVYPVRIRDVNEDTFHVYDMGGGSYNPSFMKQALNDAKKDKKKGIVLMGVKDPGMFQSGPLGSAMGKSNLVAVFDKYANHIRSVNAQFNPKDKNSRDLLKSEGGEIGRQVMNTGGTPDQPQRQLSPMGFYSAAAERASTLQPSGDAVQMVNALKNTQGIKTEELQNAGLIDESGNVHPDWAGRGKVTRDELMSHLQGQMPQVEETVLGGRRSNYQPKYEQYTLPGGENYREVLLKLPNKLLADKNFTGKRYYDIFIRKGGEPEWENLPAEQKTEIMTKVPDFAQHEFEKFKSQHWDDPNVLAHIRMSDRIGPNGEKILHVEELQSDWGQKGKKEGFAQSLDPKITDQLKSDLSLAQFKKEDARKAFNDVYENIFRENLKKYYANAPTEYDLPNALKEYDKNVKNAPPERKFQEYRGNFLRDRNSFTPEQQDMLQDAHDAYVDAHHLHDEAKNKHDEYISSSNGIPSAPYVTSTEGWTDLALKRVLKEAAEGGYDKIVWTPGAEQAKRYDLSKQISKLTYLAPDSKFGDKFGTNLRAYDHQGNVVINKTVPPKELENYVGKEVAQKLINQEADRWGKKELSGLDLSVGGEGMKGYYDSIVPKRLQNLAKKHDKNAKVGYHNISDKYHIVTPNGQNITAQPVDSEEHANDMIRTLGRDNPLDLSVKKVPFQMPGLDITPTMRESIMRGQSAYKRGGTVSKKHPALSISGTHIREETHGKPIFTGRL